MKISKKYVQKLINEEMRIVEASRKKIRHKAKKQAIVIKNLAVNELIKKYLPDGMDVEDDNEFRREDDNSLKDLFRDDDGDDDTTGKDIDDMFGIKHGPDGPTPESEIEEQQDTQKMRKKEKDLDPRFVQDGLNKKLVVMASKLAEKVNKDYFGRPQDSLVNLGVIQYIMLKLDPSLKGILSKYNKEQSMIEDIPGSQSIDGVYGGGTYAAIVKTQGKLGVKPDGIVGNKTMSALLLKLRKKQAAATTKTPRRGEQTAAKGDDVRSVVGPGAGEFNAAKGDAVTKPKERVGGFAPGGEKAKKFAAGAAVKKVQEYMEEYKKLAKAFYSATPGEPGTKRAVQALHGHLGGKLDPRYKAWGSVMNDAAAAKAYVTVPGDEWAIKAFEAVKKAQIAHVSSSRAERR